MNILIIDGQGGGIGAKLVSSVLENFPKAAVTAVGTNAAATAAMISAGAKNAATGENSVVYGCKRADVIIGPIGIVIADSLLGEITPAMAAAVGQSGGRRILIPISQCGNKIVGTMDLSVNKMVQAAVEAVKEFETELTG